MEPKKNGSLAKLDKKGPFQMFFTLSCADMRWEENFVSILNELGLKIFFEQDSDTEEIFAKVLVS